MRSVAARILPLLATTLIAAAGFAAVGADAHSHAAHRMLGRPMQAGASDVFTYAGYIADRLCVDGRTAVDGADMLLAPENHTLMCLVDLPQCTASGFCLLREDPTTGEWHCGLNFTAAETAAIATRLRALRTGGSAPTRDLWVHVSGSWTGASTFAANTDSVVFVTRRRAPARSKPLLAPPPGTSSTLRVAYEGFLADRLCVDGRTAVDGADMLLAPQNHTLHCLVDLPQCTASGFCLMQQDTTNGEWYCAHNFTAAETSALATRLRAMRTAGTAPSANLWVRVTGTWSSPATFVLDVSATVFVTPVGSTASRPLLRRPSGASAGATATYEGFLADRLCVDGRTAIDGADMLLAPRNHTLMCLIDLPQCEVSGYCLMQQDTSNAQWYCAHNFTYGESVVLAAQLGRMRAMGTARAANLWMRVSGRWATETAFSPTVSEVQFADSPSPAPVSAAHPVATTAALALAFVAVLLVGAL